MIELPEAVCLGNQLAAAVSGKTVQHVLPPTKAHKFCWYSGDPAAYAALLCGRIVQGAYGFGAYAELSFEGGKRLYFNDGVNVRLTETALLPRDYQLAVTFTDGSALVFTVAMYGGICAVSHEPEDKYYRRSKEAIPLYAPALEEYFFRVMAEGKPGLSVKAFVATEQRFPGVGNGTLQDILFKARLHPKRKVQSLTDGEKLTLLGALRSVPREMTDRGGRDTEKDLYGTRGGYRTLMSKTGLERGCPVCGGAITKEAYLGGSVYYCPVCQPLEK